MGVVCAKARQPEQRAKDLWKALYIPEKRLFFSNLAFLI